MKFAIVLAALTLSVQSSFLNYASRYRYFARAHATQAPASVHPAPAPVHPSPTPSSVTPKCTLANEEVGPSGGCKCVDGFVRKANICVKPEAVVCPQFEALNKNGACDCLSGSRDSRGICVTKLICG